MISHVKFVNVPTSDQDRALEFYTSKLGFKVLTDQPFDDKQRWIELRLPGAETSVVLFTPHGHEGRIGGFAGFAFAADNVEQTYQELSARGVEFVQKPQTHPWGTAASFKDPDGNVFVLSSRR